MGPQLVMKDADWCTVSCHAWFALVRGFGKVALFGCSMKFDVIRRALQVDSCTSLVLLVLLLPRALADLGDIAMC